MTDADVKDIRHGKTPMTGAHRAAKIAETRALVLAMPSVLGGVKVLHDFRARLEQRNIDEVVSGRRADEATEALDDELMRVDTAILGAPHGPAALSELHDFGMELLKAIVEHRGLADEIAKTQRSQTKALPDWRQAAMKAIGL